MPSAYGLGEDCNGEEARASGEGERSCGDESADNGGEEPEGAPRRTELLTLASSFLLRVAQIKRFSTGSAVLDDSSTYIDLHESET